MTTPAIGDVIEVGEPDYKYGTGTLRLRVTQVGRPSHAADGDWLDLDGYELLPDGTPLGPHPRHATVRVTAIRARRDPS